MRQLVYVFAAVCLAFFNASTAKADDQYDRMKSVQEEAEEAFRELDIETARMDSIRQANFAAVAHVELFKLEQELIANGSDSARAARVVAAIRAVVDSSIVDAKFDVGQKRLLFVEMLDDLRPKLGLSNDQVVSPVVAPDASKASAANQKIAQAQESSFVDLLAARQECNWVANVEATSNAKNPWDHTGIWTSADGKVTFALGEGKSRNMSLARDKASFNARLLFVPRGQSATLIGSTPILYRSSEEKGVFVAQTIVAIPTSLLPK